MRTWLLSFRLKDGREVSGEYTDAEAFARLMAAAKDPDAAVIKFEETV